MRTRRQGRPQRVVIAAIGLGLAATFGLAPQSHAADTWQPGKWQQPYGGCEEATLAPTSDGADQCRDHGWTIMRRLAVNPHGVVKGEGLPTCPYEDGSRVTPRCYWNGGIDGNGYGLSMYYLSHDPMQPHYVWPSSPANHGWEWVSRELGDALAEGGGLHDDTRRWERCVVHVGPTTVVRCADGHREVS